MKNYFVIIPLLFLWACGSQTIPQWKDTSFRQLENYKVNFLADKEDATEPHFVQAKKAISSNNDLNLLAMLYLNKYALHTAALENFDDREFLRIDKLQPNTANRAYYDFLKGDFREVAANQLPDVYRNIFPLIVEKNLTVAAGEIAAISDPLSRLIACGVRVKYLPYDESILQLAIDTAARQGWRRPLWAYLAHLQKYYSDHGDSNKAANIKERLELLKNR